MPDAIPLDFALDHLRRHIPVAIDGADPEGAHQVRVASRHLGVWLDLGERRALTDDLRWLRRAAGEVRDLDVLLALPLPERLARELERRRLGAQEVLVADLESARCAGLVEALRYLPPLPGQHARDGVERLALKAARRGERVDAARRKGSERRVRLHALRRAMRQLRYGREWLGERDRKLERLQTTLGDLNDLDLLQRRVAECAARRSLREYERELARRSDEALANALSTWRRARPHVLELAEHSRR